MAKKRKYQTIKCDVTEAFESGYDELEQLRDEMSEWRDNMEEKLSHTDKYERVSECADDLDSAVGSKPDETLPEGNVSYQVEIGRSPRWLRRDNALAALNAVEEFLRSYGSDDAEEESDEDTPNFDDAADNISETISTAEGVEFPGMFG